MSIFSKDALKQYTNDQLDELKALVKSEAESRTQSCNMTRLVHGKMRWSDLGNAATNGTLSNLLWEGDTFDVTLTNGEKVQFVATQDESGKWFFVLKDALKNPYHMNEECTTKGGYGKTDMRSYLHNVFCMLPDDLRRIIKDTEITQVIDGTRYTMEDELFLLSYTQVFGGDRCASQDVGDTQLNCFKRERDRVKECGERGTYPWWLRSANNSFTFYIVNSTGTMNYYYASGSNGVVFGFCIES